MPLLRSHSVRAEGIPNQHEPLHRLPAGSSTLSSQTPIRPTGLKGPGAPGGKRLLAPSGQADLQTQQAQNMNPLLSPLSGGHKKPPCEDKPSHPRDVSEPTASGGSGLSGRSVRVCRVAPPLRGITQTPIRACPGVFDSPRGEEKPFPSPPRPAGSEPDLQTHFLFF